MVAKIKLKNNKVLLWSFVRCFVSSLIILFSLIFNNIIGQNTTNKIPIFKNYINVNEQQETKYFTAIKNPNTDAMYFSNSNGILKYDSLSWDIIKTQNPPLIILKSDEEIFYYDKTEAGIININDFSIVQKTKINNNNIVKLFKINEQILLSDSNNIYKLIFNNNKLILDTIYSDNFKFSNFIINNRIICCNKKGIKIIDENGIINKNNILINQYIDKKTIDIIQNNDSYYIVEFDKERSFYKIKVNNKELFKTEEDEYISNNEYSCMQIFNNNIFIGTKKGGIVCIDTTGQRIFLLNYSCGLCNNYIQSITVDSENQKIWLCTNNGIALVDILNNIKVTNYELTINTTLPWYLRPLAIIMFIVIILVVITLILSSMRQKHKKEKLYFAEQVELKTKEISAQKEKVENMMKVWLPSRILKESDNLKNRSYDSATVIFGDISGFSKIISKYNSERVLEQLNNIFQTYDLIIKNYGITKIKTIGDAYMCVGGIEFEDNTHVIKAILAALEMQRYLETRNTTNHLKLEMRFGIHTGTLVSGIVGKNKLEYDIWGDTVNIANRMESSGEVNKINVSSETYELAKKFFDFENRGKIDVKFLGEIDMYFVSKIKNNLSEDGITPNHNFNIQLQFLTYKILETKNITKLQEGLPTNLYYHNSKHTTDVIYCVEDLCKKENVSEEDLLLLKCAALFHDMGFLISSEEHEEASVKIAREQLKTYNFSEQQITTICRLIISTKQPINPKDMLEKIICDADLNYLCRSDFVPISKNLFRELNERGIVSSEEEWNKKQYNFIKNHCYFTETAKKWNIQKETLLASLIY